eukprot:TRINITY_DN33877_c0_g1_i1.p1 TRINITY_DN33877_c0_g1~~TRINITY_DN33877_c0_g1_i1.p1  ORF type:complete len:617 (-),score=91.39 TRINITY_DN33877_c0_g1_i1:310-2160(-)
MSGMPELQHSAPPRPMNKHQMASLLRASAKHRSASSSGDEKEFTFPPKSPAETTPCFAYKGLVRVKKHSNMGCAVVTLSTDQACDYILNQGNPAHGKWLHNVDGTCCEFRRHQDKATSTLISGALFVGWGRQAEKQTPLSERALAEYVHAMLVQHVTRSRLDGDSGRHHAEQISNSLQESQMSANADPLISIEPIQATESQYGYTSSLAATQRARSRGAAVSQAVTMTRGILQARSDKREKSVLRASRRHAARSPSCRGRIRANATDPAHMCLIDIVQRAQLLAKLQTELMSWSGSALKARNAVPEQAAAATHCFQRKAKVNLTCFATGGSLAWTYQAVVHSVDFETVELVLDGSSEVEVVDWDLVRRGLLKMELSSSTPYQKLPSKDVEDALEAIAHQSFKCPCCCDDYGDVVQLCLALTKALAAAATSLRCVSTAISAVMTLRERLLLWTFESTLISLPASEVGFTHDCISNRFRHGDQDPDSSSSAGRGPSGPGVETLVKDLISGKTDLQEESELELEVVFYHGRHRSINNRRLWAFKQFAEHCGHDVDIKVRVIPLLPEATMKNGASYYPNSSMPTRALTTVIRCAFEVHNLQWSKAAGLFRKRCHLLPKRS